MTQLSILDPQLGPWGASQPDTARQAALDNYHRNPSQRERVLLALASAPHGLTDYEASVAANIARPHVAGTRRHELVAAGLVEQTCETRRTDTGSAAVVWRVTEAGRREAERLREGK